MRLSIARYWIDRRVRIVVAIGITIFLFGLGVFTSRLVDQRLLSLLADVQSYMKQKYGVAVTVGHAELGLGSITLSELSVGEAAWLVVDKVDVSVSINPLQDFLRPSSVAIGNVVVKLPWQKNLWPPEIDAIYRLMTRKVSGSGVSESEQTTALSRLIPRVLDVKAARFEAADGMETKILGEQVALKILVPQRRVRFRANQMKILDVLDEPFLDGDLIRGKDGALEIALRGKLGAKEATLWSVSCDATPQFDDLKCAVEAERMPLSLVRPLQRYLGSGFSPGFNGILDVKRQKGAPSVGVIDLTVDGEFDTVMIEHPSLSLGVVGPSFIKTKFDAAIDLNKKNIKLSRMDAKLSSAEKKTKDDWNDSLTFQADGDLSLNRNPDGKYWPSGLVHVDIDAVPCQNALKAIPANFIPELGGFKLGGSATLHLTGYLNDGTTELSIKNSSFDCMTLAVPEIYSSSYLAGPFSIERQMPDGKIYIPVDPARPYFAAYRSIPPLVRSAFVSSEDAGFFQHKGVEMAAIVGAVERNTEEGRAVVGGSTITMQTVKNLFLARDKTISRKAQEIFLAWHLERTISKERILEIYLNMVEFGPGLYGIGRASQRFFGKKVDDLTLKEAIYLASLLPAPIPRYRYFCKGEITENYNRILRQLTDRMLGLGRISAEQHAEAVGEPIKFSTLERESSCGVNKIADYDPESQLELAE